MNPYLALDPRLDLNRVTAKSPKLTSIAAINCTSCTVFPPFKSNSATPNHIKRDKRPHKKPPGCRTIYVSGMPKNSTEAIIKDIFKRFGTITDTRLNTTYWNVSFEAGKSVDAALSFSGSLVTIGDNCHADDRGLIFVDYSKAEDVKEWEMVQQRKAPQQLPSLLVPSMILSNGIAIKEARRDPRKTVNHSDVIQVEDMIAYEMVQQQNKPPEEFASSSKSSVMLSNDTAIKKACEDLKKTANFSNVIPKHKSCERNQSDVEKNTITELKKENGTLKGLVEEYKKKLDVFKKQTENEAKLEKELAKTRKQLKEESVELKLRVDSKESPCCATRRDKKFIKISKLEREIKEQRHRLKSQNWKCDDLMKQAENWQKTYEDTRKQLTELQMEKSKENELENSKLIADLQNQVGFYKKSIEKIECQLKKSFDMKESRLIGIIATFLLIHPFGIGVDNVVEYVRRLDGAVAEAEVRSVLKRCCHVFKLESGRGWTLNIFSSDVPIATVTIEDDSLQNEQGSIPKSKNNTACSSDVDPTVTKTLEETPAPTKTDVDKLDQATNLKPARKIKIDEDILTFARKKLEQKLGTNESAIVKCAMDNEELTVPEEKYDSKAKEENKSVNPGSVPYYSDVSDDDPASTVPEDTVIPTEELKRLKNIYENTPVADWSDGFMKRIQALRNPNVSSNFHCRKKLKLSETESWWITIPTITPDKLNHLRDGVTIPDKYQEEFVLEAGNSEDKEKPPKELKEQTVSNTTNVQKSLLVIPEKYPEEHQMEKNPATWLFTPEELNEINKVVVAERLLEEFIKETSGTEAEDKTGSEADRIEETSNTLDLIKIDHKSVMTDIENTIDEVQQFLSKSKEIVESVKSERCNELTVNISKTESLVCENKKLHTTRKVISEDETSKTEENINEETAITAAKLTNDNTDESIASTSKKIHTNASTLDSNDPGLILNRKNESLGQAITSSKTKSDEKTLDVEETTCGATNKKIKRPSISEDTSSTELEAQGRHYAEAKIEKTSSCDPKNKKISTSMSAMEISSGQEIIKNTTETFNNTVPSKRKKEHASKKSIETVAKKTKATKAFLSDINEATCVSTDKKTNNKLISCAAVSTTPTQSDIQDPDRLNNPKLGPEIVQNTTEPSTVAASKRKSDNHVRKSTETKDRKNSEVNKSSLETSDQSKNSTSDHDSNKKIESLGQGAIKKTTESSATVSKEAAITSKTKSGYYDRKSVETKDGKTNNETICDPTANEETSVTVSTIPAKKQNGTQHPNSLNNSEFDLFAHKDATQPSTTRFTNPTAAKITSKRKSDRKSVETKDRKTCKVDQTLSKDNKTTVDWSHHHKTKSSKSTARAEKSKLFKSNKKSSKFLSTEKTSTLCSETSKRKTDRSDQKSPIHSIKKPNLAKPTNKEQNSEEVSVHLTNSEEVQGGTDNQNSLNKRLKLLFEHSKEHSNTPADEKSRSKDTAKCSKNQHRSGNSSKKIVSESDGPEKTKKRKGINDEDENRKHTKRKSDHRKLREESEDAKKVIIEKENSTKDDTSQITSMIQSNTDNLDCPGSNLDEKNTPPGQETVKIEPTDNENDATKITITAQDIMNTSMQIKEETNEATSPQNVEETSSVSESAPEQNEPIAPDAESSKEQSKSDEQSSENRTVLDINEQPAANELPKDLKNFEMLPKDMQDLLVRFEHSDLQTDPNGSKDKIPGNAIQDSTVVKQEPAEPAQNDVPQVVVVKEEPAEGDVKREPPQIEEPVRSSKTLLELSENTQSIRNELDDLLGGSPTKEPCNTYWSSTDLQRFSVDFNLE